MSAVIGECFQKFSDYFSSKLFFNEKHSYELRYIPDRDFVPEKIKSASTACEGLCKWVRAMDVYDRVAKIVQPKQQALAEAEGDLASQMEKLNAKRAELQVILDKLQKLNDFFAEKSREKKHLEDEIDNCEKKLNR